MGYVVRLCMCGCVLACVCVRDRETLFEKIDFRASLQLRCESLNITSEVHIWMQSAPHQQHHLLLLRPTPSHVVAQHFLSACGT